MDNKPELSKEQQQEYDAMLKRAGAFEALVLQEGWKYAQSYYESQVRSLTTSILVQDSKQIAEFENKRREVIGLRKFFKYIEGHLETLAKYRKDEQAKSQATAKQ